MASSSYLYKRFDFPRNILLYLNDFKWRMLYLQFNVDEFSKEEEALLTELINKLGPVKTRHLRMRYVEKLTYREIARRNEESIDTMYHNLGAATRGLVTKIIEQRLNFPSLHWQYDYLYRFDFSQSLPPVQEKYRVYNFNEYPQKMFTVFLDTPDEVRTVNEGDFGKCIDNIIWLPESDLTHAMEIFIEFLEKEILEMENKLPLYKAQLLLAKEYHA